MMRRNEPKIVHFVKAQIDSSHSKSQSNLSNPNELGLGRVTGGCTQDCMPTAGVVRVTETPQKLPL